MSEKLTRAVPANIAGIETRIGAQGQPIRQVTAWAVSPSSTASVAILYLMDEARASKPMPYVLSLPTAKQLADRLQEAVETCLNHAPEME